MNPTEAYSYLAAMFDRMTIAQLAAFIRRVATIQGLPLTDGRAILDLCRSTFQEFDGATQEIVALAALNTSHGFIPVPIEDLLNPDLQP